MPEVAWLDDDEQRMWRAFLHAFALLTRQLERELRERGLSLADYEVLAMVSEGPAEGLRMTRLADQLVLTKSRLSHQVRRMEDAGQVRRVPCDDDRRGWFVTLTPAGRRALVAAAGTHVTGVRTHLFDHIDAADVTTVRDAFESVVEALRAPPE